MAAARTRTFVSAVIFTAVPPSLPDNGVHLFDGEGRTASLFQATDERFKAGARPHWPHLRATGSHDLDRDPVARPNAELVQHRLAQRDLPLWR